jgi:hypothetical protein
MWNAAFAFAWMVLVPPLFLDEYATAGVWLAEPVPVSLVRGLGFGFEGKRQWWVWDGPWAEVSWGRRWSETKIQFAYFMAREHSFKYSYLGLGGPKLVADGF